MRRVSRTSLPVVRAVAVPLGLGVAVSLCLSLSGDAAEPGAPPGYSVAVTTAERALLLAGDEAAWAPAAAVAWGPATYETRFRALWNGDGLYLRFDATDPAPWHTMTKRDEHLWEEEVVEIFLDADRSGRDYYELEISPANVVCDLHMISPMPNYKSSFAWDLAGLETSVHVLKDAAGRATGWTATAFLPWAGLRPLPSAARVATPPKPGDRWRFNVFRIDRPGGKANPQQDAVQVAWSPPTLKSFHDPSAFRDLVFVDAR